jgi:hypothetical protein
VELEAVCELVGLDEVVGELDGTEETDEEEEETVLGLRADEELTIDELELEEREEVDEMTVEDEVGVDEEVDDVVDERVLEEF